MEVILISLNRLRINANKMPYKIEFNNVEGRKVCMRFKSKKGALKQKTALNKIHVYVQVSELKKGNKCK